MNSLPDSIPSSRAGTLRFHPSLFEGATAFTRCESSREASAAKGKRADARGVWDAPACSLRQRDPTRLARRNPQVWLPPEGDPHKQVAELYASPQEAPELEYPEPSLQSTQHHGLKGDFTAAAAHSNAEERCERLGCNTVQVVAERGVHSIVLRAKRDFCGRVLLR